MRRHLLSVAVLAAAAPAARAQDTTAAVPRAEAPAERTHTVKKGDTLWDLARAYIGDPFQWPEIYRINTDVVEDPHWIYPGEELRIPGSTGAEAEVAEEPAPAPSRETVFSPRAVSTLTSNAFAGEGLKRTTVRIGEYERAPYVDRNGAPHGAGRIVGTTELDPAGNPLPRQQYMLFERVFISGPRDVDPAVGARFVAVARGPELNGMGQVIVPTAMLEVVRAATGRAAAEAQVVEMYDALRPEHRILPYDSTPAMGYVPAEPVDSTESRETKIRWIIDQPELPSLQHYVLLEVGSKQGVHVGDEYVLYEPQRSLGAGRPRSQDIEIARVQVLRVTPQGSTAMVIGQRRPSIRPGVRARLAARVP